MVLPSALSGSCRACSLEQLLILIVLLRSKHADRSRRSEYAFVSPRILLVLRMCLFRNRDVYHHKRQRQYIIGRHWYLSAFVSIVHQHCTIGSTMFLSQSLLSLLLVSQNQKCHDFSALLNRIMTKRLFSHSFIPWYNRLYTYCPIPAHRHRTDTVEGHHVIIQRR